MRSVVQVYPGPPFLDRDAAETSAADVREGGVAQLGERRLCKPEVVGSIPSASTNVGAVTEAIAAKRLLDPNQGNEYPVSNGNIVAFDAGFASSRR